MSVLSVPMGQPDSEVGTLLGGAPQCRVGGGVNVGRMCRHMNAMRTIAPITAFYFALNSDLGVNGVVMGVYGGVV